MVGHLDFPAAGATLQRAVHKNVAAVGRAWLAVPGVNVTAGVSTLRNLQINRNLEQGNHPKIIIYYS